jgi:hypothetical protein
LASGVDQDGDHCRTYVDETQKYSFHVLVNQGLTFLCFATNELEKGVCVDFLYDLAASFVEHYAASLDDQDVEVFRDFEATMLVKEKNKKLQVVFSSCLFCRI